VRNAVINVRGEEIGLKYLHLNCLAKIVPPTLSLNDLLIDFARRDVVISSQGGQKIAFVITDV
jgi:hypothetical protein